MVLVVGYDCMVLVVGYDCMVLVVGHDCMVLVVGLTSSHNKSISPPKIVNLIPVLGTIL